MKFLAVVFVFAFVAVQFSCSAPTPDEEKKEEAVGVPARAGDSAAPAAEVKSAPKEQPAAATDPTVHAEDKKA